MSKPKTHGICALTGKKGKFVKSHLIPQALTAIGDKGAAQYEIASSSRQKKRFTSWYDQALVIRAGEEILSDLDDWGIKFLRREGLVWSAPAQSIQALEERSDEESLSLVEIPDLQLYRRFFLSLLWRAASSKLPEFSEINLDEGSLNLLKDIVSGSRTAEDYTFPFHLVRLSTRGPDHNMTPICVQRPYPEVVDPITGAVISERYLDFFRFYMDGLIVLFLAKSHAIEENLRWQAAFSLLGNSVPVINLPYEKSFHELNLNRVAWEHELNFPLRT